MIRSLIHYVQAHRQGKEKNESDWAEVVNDKK